MKIKFFDAALQNDALFSLEAQINRFLAKANVKSMSLAGKDANSVVVALLYTEKPTKQRKRKKPGATIPNDGTTM